MNITQNLISFNFTRRTNKVNEYIVIHYFGGLGSAASVAAYFNHSGVQASAHYEVDDTSVVQAVLDSDTAWHCGDAGKGTYKGRCCNANSIGIEVRPYKLDTSRASSATDKDWYFHAETIAKLTELVRLLMAKYSIDADHVIRHYDVTAKWCPRPWMGDDINTYYGKTGNELWAEFKTSLTESEDDTMTGEAIYNALKEYTDTAEAPEWAKAELQEAVTAGITDGTRPMELIPRYQAAIMAKRAAGK